MSLTQLLHTPGLTIDGLEDIEGATEFSLEHGWGDGLPIVPPTVDRVERMLQYCDRPWDESIATMPPRNGAVTPLRLAANAVMAGCRPAYFPLLLLAVEAMCDESLNLYGIQTTTYIECFPAPPTTTMMKSSGHCAIGYLPSFGETRSITRVLKRSDGSIASSVEEFRV